MSSLAVQRCFMLTTCRLSIQPILRPLVDASTPEAYQTPTPTPFLNRLETRLLYVQYILATVLTSEVAFWPPLQNHPETDLTRWGFPLDVH